MPDDVDVGRLEVAARTLQEAFSKHRSKLNDISNLHVQLDTATAAEATASAAVDKAIQEVRDALSPPKPLRPETLQASDVRKALNPGPPEDMTSV